MALAWWKGLSRNAVHHEKREKAIATALRELSAEAEQDIELLLQKRYEKFRKIGVFQEINQL